MKCICCENKITPSSYESDINLLNHEDYVFKNEIDFRAENRMWNNGVVGNISSGYGSKHDGDMFVIAICDDCINLKKENGTLAYTGNYMSLDEPGDVEKHKRIWRRSNNLDDLV